MNKDERLSLIEHMLAGFCGKFLPQDVERLLAYLLDACADCEALNLARGNPEVWAAAIACAFCRMNFILDGGSPCGLNITRDQFFAFFSGCNRSTVTQKATKIERELNFHHGDPFFSLPSVINGLPRLVELPGGFVGMESAPSVEISFMDEEESRRFDEELRFREQEQQKEKQREAEEREKKRLEEIARKREEERKTQPEFDF